MLLDDSFVYIIHKLLRSNNYIVDKEELISQLNSNPFYPSLRAVTGSLQHFVKECSALKVPVNKTVLVQLPLTFIAQIKRAEQELFVYVENNNDYIIVHHRSGDKHKILIDDFLSIWTGVIVAIEKKPLGSNKRLYKLRGILVGVLMIMIIGLFINGEIGIFEFTHFLLSLLGVFVCGLIVMHEMGIQSGIFEKICSNNNELSGCDAVMNSLGAKLFGKIKLSDIGIVYFISLTFIWLFYAYSHPNLIGIVIISCIAMPFTFYSLFYQFKIVKRWCPLCLTIMFILWLQALFIMLYRFDDLLYINLSSVLIILFSFLITSILWGWVAPKITAEKNYFETKANYYRFKRNFSLFKRIIVANPKVDDSISGISEILFGNRNAPLKLCFITSPLCGYCKEVHTMIKEILTLANKNAQITIRFNINLNSTNDYSVKICSRLLELFHVSGESECLEALDDIYGNMLPFKWIQKWGEVENGKYSDTLFKEREWCLNNNVDFTPEIIVNGREFPREYERTDLLFFIDELIENCNLEPISQKNKTGNNS